jgi:hypothetical protein
MRNIQYIAYTLLFVFILSSCKDFDELETNPNKPEFAPPSLILNGVLNDLYEQPWSLEHRQNQYWACNYNYYGTNEYWSSTPLDFMTLKNILKMEEEAKRLSEEEAKPYMALGKFLRAYYYVKMSQRVGDLPLDEALKGVENTEPVYNAQKEIYVQVLQWLDESNLELEQSIAGDKRIGGDIYFNNDLGQWQKAVNTFKLRVLMSLSKKESDADLNIVAKFKEVMDSPTKFPLMSGLSDNMEYVYNGTSNLYPTNPGNKGFDKGRYNMAATYIGTLTDLKDPRVFVVANPAKKKITSGVAPSDFNAYVGAPSGESLDNMTLKAGNGEYSFANQKRYYGTLKGPEPGVQIGYPELCFTIAEAINRGWIAGNAETYYNNGVIASMNFYGISDGTTLIITDSDEDKAIGSVTTSVTDYLAQPKVKYAGNNEAGLNQILTQKYLAFFQSSGQEAYFNYRRTGLPDFHEGPGTGNNGHIPRRWLYPVSEATNNRTNYTAALMRQFGSEVDDVNNDLWINK